MSQRARRHYLLLWRDIDVATPYPDAARLPVTPATVTLEIQTASHDGDLRVVEIG